MITTDILICECHSIEHQIVFRYGDENGFPVCYIEIHLNKHSFWRRVRYALAYIFGRQCRFGAFDEFIINPADADKFKKLIEYLEHK